MIVYVFLVTGKSLKKMIFKSKNSSDFSNLQGNGWDKRSAERVSTG